MASRCNEKRGFTLEILCACRVCCTPRETLVLTHSKQHIEASGKHGLRALSRAIAGGFDKVCRARRAKLGSLERPARQNTKSRRRPIRISKSLTARSASGSLPTPAHRLHEQHRGDQTLVQD